MVSNDSVISDSARNVGFRRERRFQPPKPKTNCVISRNSTFVCNNKSSDYKDKPRQTVYANVSVPPPSPLNFRDFTQKNSSLTFKTNFYVDCTITFSSKYTIPPFIISYKINQWENGFREKFQNLSKWKDLFLNPK